MRGGMLAVLRMRESIIKSDWLAAQQCVGMAWRRMRAEPEPPDEVERFRMEQGQEVGRLARSIDPGGVLIPSGKRARFCREDCRGGGQRRVDDLRSGGTGGSVRRAGGHSASRRGRLGDPGSQIQILGHQRYRRGDRRPRLHRDGLPARGVSHRPSVASAAVAQVPVLETRPSDFSTASIGRPKRSRGQRNFARRLLVSLTRSSGTTRPTRGSGRLPRMRGLRQRVPGNGSAVFGPGDPAASSQETPRAGGTGNPRVRPPCRRICH